MPRPGPSSEERGPGRSSAPQHLPPFFADDTFRLVTHRPRFSLLVAFSAALLAAPRALPAQAAGSFLSTRIDDRALPMSDRVTDDEGTTYLVEFERLVLTLRPGNRFRAAVRVRRTLTSADRRAQGRQVPIQSMTVNGTYVVMRGEIRFTPDSSGDAKGMKMLAGTVETGDRIAVPFTYRNGAVQRQRVLRLERRDDII